MISRVKRPPGREQTAFVARSQVKILLKIHTDKNSDTFGYEITLKENMVRKITFIFKYLAL